MKIEFAERFMGNKIQAHMIENNHEKLDDDILKYSIESIKYAFDERAWVKLKQMYNKKIEYCTCSVCNELCFNYCIRCSQCQYWFHFRCVNPTKVNKRSTSMWCCNKATSVNLKCKK